MLYLEGVVTMVCLSLQRGLPSLFRRTVGLQLSSRRVSLPYSICRLFCRRIRLQAVIVGSPLLFLWRAERPKSLLLSRSMFSDYEILLSLHLSGRISIDNQCGGTYQLTFRSR
mmetsp:Transcript_2321/g.5297  ORF Transcript_2321/g.5297 Transcript_2321/m.5297 type:complete len:113 (-) Transcript_2321:229-567(-)